MWVQVLIIFAVTAIYGYIMYHRGGYSAVRKMGEMIVDAKLASSLRDLAQILRESENKKERDQKL